jgi:hypothetical protein
MYASESIDLLGRGKVCDWCGKQLPAGATIRRRFCDSTCRVTNHRCQPDSSRP